MLMIVGRGSPPSLSLPSYSEGVAKTAAVLRRSAAEPDRRARPWGASSVGRRRFSLQAIAAVRLG